MLSSSYVIIMDRAMNAPSNGYNVVDEVNSTEKCYLKQKMEQIGKLENNDTTNIRIIPSASKYFSINFVDQCMHNINNKDRLNLLK